MIFAVSSAPAGEFAVHYGYTSLYILRSNGNRGPSLKKILTDGVIFAVSSAPAGEFAVHYGYTSLYILRSNGNRGPSLKKILTDEVTFWLFLRLLQRILPFIMATPLYDQKQRRQ